MTGQWQGTEGWKIGNLKRQLPTQAVIQFDGTIASNDGEGLPDYVQRLWLTGLNGNLRVLIACGIANGTKPFAVPTPNPGTLQLYPATKFGDAKAVILRPVFQDPTSTTNTNVPLPQDIPFGWEGAFTECDAVMIEVTVSPDGGWFNSGLSAQLVVQVTVEFNGSWQDVQSIDYAMGQVQLSAVNPIVIGTAAP